MSFSHPLARDAHIWSTGGKKSKSKPMLVIITTLALDKDHKNYKADKVAKLREAASQWIDENEDSAVDYIVMNRPKKWSGDRD